jgi:hypothetical protein
MFTDLISLTHTPCNHLAGLFSRCSSALALRWRTPLRPLRGRWNRPTTNWSRRGHRSCRESKSLLRCADIGLLPGTHSFSARAGVGGPTNSPLRTHLSRLVCRPSSMLGSLPRHPPIAWIHRSRSATLNQTDIYHKAILPHLNQAQLPPLARCLSAFHLSLPSNVGPLLSLQVIPSPIRAAPLRT